MDDRPELPKPEKPKPFIPDSKEVWEGSFEKLKEFLKQKLEEKLRVEQDIIELKYTIGCYEMRIKNFEKKKNI